MKLNGHRLTKTLSHSHTPTPAGHLNVPCEDSEPHAQLGSPTCQKKKQPAPRPAAHLMNAIVMEGSSGAVAGVSGRSRGQ
ncbi:hypothetical protein HaLaN_17322 [Haematococcus lacustris]|uniref:Uncharacterized protein n=1 Tax=Haematococcus lacustris TaxID=44745 RepID=A0A699ZWA9_HAELA|nr:hypothetical protein HaLaN_17322 [Haematococcus lacustris]